MTGSPNGSGIRVEVWNEGQFRDSAATWGDVLARSDADPLFMSWDWLWLWWRHQSSILGDCSLLLLAAYETNDRLVGLAPLYLRSVSHRGGIRATRLESLGSVFRARCDVFSEYLDIIADRSRRDDILEAFAGALLEEGRWSDFVFSNTSANGLAARLVRERLQGACFVRETDGLEAHAARLPGTFEEYVKALSGGIRRKVLNHRAKLSRPEFAQVGDVDEFLDLMDGFHRQRWGRPHYIGSRRRFHLDFAAAMAARGALRLTELRVDGQPISTLYNLRIGQTEYNLQAGFDATRVAGVSPGYLHFGYCVERACAEGVKLFDFLAGDGRTRDYKQDFLTRSRPLVTLHAVRARPLAWLYRGHQYVQSIKAQWPGARLS